ncbi:hypothetical protein Tco_0642694 [Tanacetum coccineum]
MQGIAKVAICGIKVGCGRQSGEERGHGWVNLTGSETDLKDDVQVSKTNGSNSKPKIAKSVISNKIEPGTSRRSNTSVAPSSSSSVNLSSQFRAAPKAVDLADSPVSTSIDQDAPSTSILSTQEQEYSPIISQGFKESPKMPHFHNDPLHESLHEDSTSQGSSSNVRPVHTPFESLGRWTKDHPIANVIGDPSRFVSTRKQLQTNAMWCYFDAFLTSVEPKNFKQAMTKPSWIDAMQE